MITRNALYDFTDALITNAPDGSALSGAYSFRNLKSSVDEFVKVVRIDCIEGQLCRTDEAKKEELNVRFTAQFWVTPEPSNNDEEAALDDAIDLSFDMAKQFYNGMADDPGLGGLVCDSYADVFETGDAKLGSINRGVTYLDGLINQAS